MPICKNCKADCLQEIPASCVPLNPSEDIGCLGIEAHQEISIRDAFLAQAKEYCDFLERNKVELGCLQGDCPECTESVVQSYDAVKKLIEFACNLDSDQVGTGANLYCLSGLSLSAAKIRQRDISWNTQTLSDGLNFTYNLSQVLEQLPTGFNVNSVSIKANGYNKGTAKTLLANVSDPVGGFKLKVDNFPVNVNFEVQVGTPDGAVVLNKVISINSAVTSGANYTSLESSDYSDNKNFAAVTQTYVNEVLAAGLCQLRTLYDSLKQIQVSNCDGITYADKHINSVIQVHSSTLCDIVKRLNNIGAEKVSHKECDDLCGENIIEISLQESLDRKDNEICSLKSRVKLLEEQYAELSLKVERCCNGT